MLDIRLSYEVECSLCFNSLVNAVLINYARLITRVLMLPIYPQYRYRLISTAQGSSHCPSNTTL